MFLNSKQRLTFCARHTIAVFILDILDSEFGDIAIVRHIRAETSQCIICMWPSGILRHRHDVGRLRIRQLLLAAPDVRLHRVERSILTSRRDLHIELLDADSGCAISCVNEECSLALVPRE